ncbi:hypothetical protein [Actinocorallia longicatena]|uniref:Uncharacterized protein n=1 Tax=Actinocorallia longicatena TaxID=111803 RepID=A0ABP6QP29_9ACTN
MKLTPEEEARFVREMIPMVSETVRAGRRFRISADTPDLVRMFQAVTSGVSDVLGHPVRGYGNGREFFIENA